MWCYKNYEGQFSKRHLCYVSIPMWCYKDPISAILLTRCSLVSIPMWCYKDDFISKMIVIKRKFQFQCGAIKTFHRLKTAIIDNVSIPMWCYKDRIAEINQQVRGCFNSNVVL